MPQNTVSITYGRIADAERSYGLCRGFEKIGYTASSSMVPEQANILVEIDGSLISADKARAFIESELVKLNVDLVVLENGKNLPLPAYETEGSAGMDLRAAWSDFGVYNLFPGEKVVVPCGISIALPLGYEAQIRPRSGLAAKHGITVLNSPGTIDSDYRGEIMAILINHGKDNFLIQRGDRVAQMVIAPVTQARFKIVTDLPTTTRGEGRFGSTGRQ